MIFHLKTTTWLQVRPYLSIRAFHHFTHLPRVSNFSWLATTKINKIHSSLTMSTYIFRIPRRRKKIKKPKVRIEINIFSTEIAPSEEATTTTPRPVLAPPAIPAASPPSVTRQATQKWNPELTAKQTARAETTPTREYSTTPQNVTWTDRKVIECVNKIIFIRTGIR